MRHLLREPLLHFILLGALLLLLNHFWEEARKPLVRIGPKALEAQLELSAQRVGRPLSAEEREQVAQRMLEDEILFIEAQKRGMVSDNRVRGSLITMMRSALKPVLTAPSQAELDAVRDSLPRESTFFPAQLSFDHVSFANAAEAPADLLTQLRQGVNPSSFKNSVRLANPLPLTYRPQLERLMGSAFTKTIFELPLNEWQGPITSDKGTHWVRITSRAEDQPMPNEQLRPILESRWRERGMDSAISAEVDKLKVGYRIEVPTP
jgi:hypothetical protein